MRLLRWHESLLVLTGPDFGVELCSWWARQTLAQ
ncbi:MAG: hypothetical protein ACI9TF_000288, partial [Paracrocinitomix sp.]